jgi:hypothetical protein
MHGQRSTCSWLKVAGVGSATSAPTARSILQMRPCGSCVGRLLPIDCSCLQREMRTQQLGGRSTHSAANCHAGRTRASTSVINEMLDHFAHLQLAAYRSSSPVVALWLGRPAATLAAASAAEFFTGEYAAQTCGSHHCCLICMIHEGS